MERNLKELIALVKELPERYLGEAFDKLKEVKEKAKGEEEADREICPKRGSREIVRNGHKCKKQAYLCKGCGKSFVQTSGSAMENSRSGETVWKQVIRDTVEGVSLDRTAENLDLTHTTVFNRRHKILCCVEQEFKTNPTKLSGVCETDETYVLESLKGRKIPENYYRKPRKHGAVGMKRGLSNEYICLCTSVTEDNRSVSVAVNRATPSKEEILEVFGDRVDEDTLILCEGNKSYDVLETKCRVATSKSVNKVNGFHSFIKERNLRARVLATIYLNRYNALFSRIFANRKTAVDEIYKLMTRQDGNFKSISDIKMMNLLTV
jgi:transposase-like protein